jgi:hypothetical protein
MREDPVSVVRNNRILFVSIRGLVFRRQPSRRDLRDIQQFRRL